MILVTHRAHTSVRNPSTTKNAEPNPIITKVNIAMPSVSRVRIVVNAWGTYPKIIHTAAPYEKKSIAVMVLSSIWPAPGRRACFMFKKSPFQKGKSYLSNKGKDCKVPQKNMHTGAKMNTYLLHTCIIVTIFIHTFVTRLCYQETKIIDFCNNLPKCNIFVTEYVNFISLYFSCL